MAISPAAVVADILRDRGPLDAPGLLDAARQAGARMSATDLDDLLHGGDDLPLAVCLPEGRHGLADQILAGRVFTHRLTAFDIEYDTLPADPDLGALAPLLDAESTLLNFPSGEMMWADDVDEDRRDQIIAAAEAATEELIRDGGPLALAVNASYYVAPVDEVDPTALIALPVGTLAGYQAGDVIGIRMTASGAMLGAVAAVDAPPAFGETVGHVLDSLNGAGSEQSAAAPTVPVDIGTLAMALCAADEAAFTEALPPLSELLPAAGFTVIGGDVAAGDVDPADWRVTLRAADYEHVYGISTTGALAVAHITPWIRWAADVLAAGSDHDLEGTGGIESDAAPHGIPDVTMAPPLPDDAADVARLVEPFGDPDVAEALVAEALGIDVEPAAPLGALVESWEQYAPRGAAVGLRWIRSRCEERLGDCAAAESSLQAARGMDRGWAPVLRDLAYLASDRGDAPQAIALLRRAGADDDDPELALLAGLASPARRDIGRNQLCWCGSGRKYKVCHLGKELLPLAQRVVWLYHKARRYADSGPFRYVTLDLATIMSQFDTTPLAILRALDDPLVIDAVLFEGGGLQEFLEVRGRLLPDDERSLLEQWLLIERSVYEVTAVRTGLGLTVRDIRTGDVLDVAERTGSRTVRKGMRLLLHLLPADGTGRGTMLVFGGAHLVPMHLEQRALQLCDELASGDAGPEDLVALVASRHAPPTLQTTDGEPLVQCTATYRVADGDALARTLGGLFEDDGDGHFTWTHGESEHPTVLAQLQLAGQQLTAETMNEKRLAELRRRLDRINGLELIEVQRVPAEQMMQQGVPRSASAVDDDFAERPEVRAALADFARSYETRWLDERIPALGGFTPREAAADPTRRGDLIRLLDSFDDQPGPGLMQPDRLRAALGL